MTNFIMELLYTRTFVLVTSDGQKSRPHRIKKDVSHVSVPASTRGEHGQDQDWISSRILAIFSDQDWIWIFIFEKNWIRTESGYWFDFYNEIFLRPARILLQLSRDSLLHVNTIYHSQWRN